MVRSLRDVFPEAHHLRFYHLEHCSDSEIWEFAKQNGYSIVTKDSDFHQRSLVYGAPPKVVWFKLKNSARSMEEEFCRSSLEPIRSFLEETTSSLLILSEDSNS
ncbi:DUF5615 family PIN-like protein [Thalassobacterium maritimum]|uniref:DUF5615 family PIN-like protein n=1 Tax=Thalassobacterium maritimum TaxID=3041265 RepID=UPI003CE5240B